MPAATVPSTGIPAGWNVQDYSKDFQGEINRIKAINPNDPRIPLLTAARQEKLATMTNEELAKAGVTRTGEVIPKVTSPTTTAAKTTLGTLSAKYESNGNPGAISTGAGDLGGKSYGTYQLSSNMGSLGDFVNWLKNTNSTYYQKLYNAYTTGGIGYGQNFDTAWKQIAQSDPAGFEKLQHDYIQSKYYDPTATQLKSLGLDISNRSAALQNAVWSAAVQYGVNGAMNLFEAINLKGDDSSIISALYDRKAATVEQSFSGSSQDVRNGVANRIQQEKKDALAMLSQEGQKTETAPVTAAVPTTAAVITTPTQLTQPDGSSRTYTDESTGQPWAVENYSKDYQAEINRLQKIDATDPRIDLLLKARAEKIKSDPTLYADPNNKRWADDILSGTWDVRDYEGNYQAEINKLQAKDPSDPRISVLEAARSKKILENPSVYDKGTLDWAIAKDKEGWKAENYSSNYQAEINRISKFDPNDSRIKELQNLRAEKILTNPDAYDEATVDWATSWEEEHRDEMEMQKFHKQYTEAEVQADIQTQRAAKAQ